MVILYVVIRSAVGSAIADTKDELIDSIRKALLASKADQERGYVEELPRDAESMDAKTRKVEERLKQEEESKEGQGS